MPGLYTVHKLNFPQPNPALFTCMLKPCLHLISQSCHKVLSHSLAATKFFSFFGRGNESFKWKYSTHIIIFQTKKENLQDPTILNDKQQITRITSWHRKTMEAASMYPMVQWCNRKNMTSKERTTPALALTLQSSFTLSSLYACFLPSESMHSSAIYTDAIALLAGCHKSIIQNM